EPGVPRRMTRARGCRVWDADGREYLDYVMALGAVALGYGHEAVNRAAQVALDAGVVGPLPPVLEAELAEALARRIPWLERVRFLKTGAEAVAAAVRLARVATGRELVFGCGYHGWLDWSQGRAGGVPAGGGGWSGRTDGARPPRLDLLAAGDGGGGARGGPGDARRVRARAGVRAPAAGGDAVVPRPPPAATRPRGARRRGRRGRRDELPAVRERRRFPGGSGRLRAAGPLVQADGVQLCVAGP